MYALEMYLKSRKEKVRAWRKRGEAWVKEKNGDSRYSYYSFKDYEERFPCPVIQWGKVASVALPILGVVVVVSLGILAIVNAPPKKVDPNNPNDCTNVVKKGDKVGVTATTYDGSQGVVLEQRKDCSVDIKLEKSTWTMDICKKVDRGWCDDTLDKEDILHIDRSSDIVKL